MAGWSGRGSDLLPPGTWSSAASTITVHHGALAFLTGINALRASEAAGVRVDDYAGTMRGHPDETIEQTESHWKNKRSPADSA